MDVTSLPDAPRIYMNDETYLSTQQLQMDEDSNLTLNFTVWEVDQSPFYHYLNDSTFTFTSIFGSIYPVDFNPLYWDIDTTNGILTAHCIDCEFTHDIVTLTYIPDLDANSKVFGNESIEIDSVDVDGTEGITKYYVTVNPINDPVVVSCPVDTVTAFEDTPVDFNWTVEDPDSDENAGYLWISIVALNGTFYFDIAQTPPFILSQGDITGNSSTLIGETTLIGAQILLRDLRFMSLPNFNGDAAITVSINDQGHHGEGDSFWSNCSQNMLIYSQNDALTLSDSMDYVVHIAEDKEYFIEDMLLVDDDANAAEVYSVVVRFESEMENISFPQVPAAVVAVTESQKVFTVQGMNYATVQLLVGNISVFPASNFNGYNEMTVEVTSNDTSVPNPEFAIAEISMDHLLRIHGVNDGPVITAQSSLVIDEDDCGSISIGVTDLDFHEMYSGHMTGTIECTNCTFSIESYFGLNYVDGEPLNSDLFKFHCASLHAMNIALSQITICSGSPPDFYGDAAVDFNISDNGYSFGDDAVDGVHLNPLWDAVTIPVTINPVVDLVVISMEDQYDGLEDVAMSFVINISTVDLIKPILSVSMTSSFGNLSTTSSAVSDIVMGHHSLSFNGDWNDVDDALSNLEYLGDADWNGFDDDLSITINITSTGQISTAKSTVFLDAVNDPITVSTADQLSYTLWEDEEVRIDGVSISDLDARDDPNQLIRAIINCTNGLLSLSTFQGMAYLQGNGTMDSVIEIQGGFEHIDAALNLIRFYPDSDWFGSAVVEVHVFDDGFTGTGSQYEDSLQIPITVVSTPDAPTLGIGTDSSCNEDESCNFIGGTVSDSDSDHFQIALSVDHGVLTLNGTNGLSFVSGNGTSDRWMVFNGSTMAINNAIGDISYQPDEHWNGHDSVVVTLTDFETAVISHELDVEVVAVNDGPDVMVSIDSFSALDSVPLSIRGISISDLDFYESFGGLCALNISAENGSLSLGAMESVNQQRDSGSISLLTDLNNMNRALLHLMYQSTAYFEGVDVITVTFSDLENSGSSVSGGLTDSETINVAVSAVNHEPVLTKYSDLIEMDEDGMANFSFTVGDEDCGGIGDGDCNLTLTVESHQGVIRASKCLELTSSEWTTQIVVHGNISRINECATDLTLSMTPNWNGILGHEIEVSLNDNGFQGVGHSFLVTDVIAVNVSSINDALSIFSTASDTLYSVKSGYSTPLNGPQIEDIDLNATNTELLMVNITASFNKIGLYALNGLHFLNIPGNGKFSRTERYSNLDFYGTIYSINQALPYLYFHSTNASHCGNDSVHIQVAYASESVDMTLTVTVDCS